MSRANLTNTISGVMGLMAGALLVAGGETVEGRAAIWAGAGRREEEGFLLLRRPTFTAEGFTVLGDEETGLGDYLAEDLVLAVLVAAAGPVERALRIRSVEKQSPAALAFCITSAIGS